MNPDLIPVLVTTEHRGVFFGWADVESVRAAPSSLRLERARNVFYWSKNDAGFLGLASEGPRKGSKIGAQVDWLVVKNITAIVGCTPASVKAFTDGGWG